MRLIRARIDSAALRANLRAVRARAPHSRVMAVVKANAYGHGLVPAALALADADAFAVARLEEAVTLRDHGLRRRMVLLEGVFDAAQLAQAAQLELDLVVHQWVQIALLEAFRAPRPLSLWLKVDTGMNRLGFRPEEFRAAWQRLRQLQPAPSELRVMTHLACADDPDDGASAEQLQRLQPLVAGLEAELSIANSAAILALPQAHAHWVRPGLALYGVSPFIAQRGGQLGLRAAMTLESTVIALRDIGIGDTTEQAKFTVERAESVRGEQQHVRCLCDVQQIVDSSSLRRLHPHLLPTAAPLRIGWPGAAQLRHGSLVRIGCGTYVFAVVD